MACFDRFDIAEAHCLLEWDYNKGGILLERPTNARLMRSTGVQLHNMKFRPAPGLSYDSLTDNGKEIYLENVLRWKLPLDEEQRGRIFDTFAVEWLRQNYPHVFTD